MTENLYVGAEVEVLVSEMRDWRTVFFLSISKTCDFVVIERSDGMGMVEEKKEVRYVR